MSSTKAAVQNACQRVKPCRAGASGKGIVIAQCDHFLDFLKKFFTHNGWMYAGKVFQGCTPFAVTPVVGYSLVRDFSQITSPLEHISNDVFAKRTWLGSPGRTFLTDGYAFSVVERNVHLIERFGNHFVGHFPAGILLKYPADYLTLDRMGNHDFAVAFVFPAEIRAIAGTVGIGTAGTQTIAITIGNGA
nr:hypothetical protein [Anaerolinea sp.]